jgi:hypothetical protein
MLRVFCAVLRVTDTADKQPQPYLSPSLLFSCHLFSSPPSSLLFSSLLFSSLLFSSLTLPPCDRRRQKYQLKNFQFKDDDGIFFVQIIKMKMNRSITVYTQITMITTNRQTMYRVVKFMVYVLRVAVLTSKYSTARWSDRLSRSSLRRNDKDDMMNK